MAQSMIASKETINDGQIETAVDQLRAAMRKHRAELPKEASQMALGADNLGMKMFAVFRGLVEAASGFLVHIVKVNRTRTPQVTLDATGRRQYKTQDVVDAMPRGKDEEVELIYFKPDPSLYKNGWISCSNVAAEYERLGLKPDPVAQVDDNATNPAFADEHPNAGQWNDENGSYCYVAFDRWVDDERDVYVFRCDFDWDDDRWFAGRRK